MEYGCIGRKLSHSFSKTIHGELCDYEYELLELEPEELESFFEKRDFRAINVTIPYKRDVMPFLDVIEERAKRIGAVNTVVNRGGVLYGYNTDYGGMRALIRRVGADPRGKKVAILGSGGTSRTVLAVVRDLGAGEAFRVSRSGGEGLVTYDRIPEDTDIIINTTPCGMYPNVEGAAVDISRFPRLSGVIDAVYNPLRSTLVLDAKERGIPAEGGLYMLVAQAVFAAEHFTGRRFDESETDRVFAKLVAQKQNVVLIGMPGCGKSTVGAALGEVTDTDALIREREGCEIAEIFARGGEALFRDIETEVIAALATEQGRVIATGGGAVLRAENVKNLRRNGVLVFIDRPPELLTATADRPLSSDEGKLRALYEARLPVYNAVCDIRVDGSGSVSEVAERIRNECKDISL